jgi:hypothetical protein
MKVRCSRAVRLSNKARPQEDADHAFLLRALPQIEHVFAQTNLSARGASRPASILIVVDFVPFDRGNRKVPRLTWRFTRSTAQNLSKNRELASFLSPESAAAHAARRSYCGVVSGFEPLFPHPCLEPFAWLRSG